MKTSLVSYGLYFPLEQYIRAPKTGIIRIILAKELRLVDLQNVAIYQLFEDIFLKNSKLVENIK